MADKTGIEWTDATVTRFQRAAAQRIGVPIETYLAKLAAGQKWCTSCKAWHPRKSFGRDASRSDGLASKCLGAAVVGVDRPGARERRRARAKGLAWCSDCAYWLPHHLVAQGRCREHRNAAARDWYSHNRVAVSLRKSARKRGLAPIPEWWRDDAMAAFGGACAYGCGRVADTLDHVTPYARGGLSEPANLVPACVSCNSSKRDNEPAPWIAKGIAAFPDQWHELTALAMQVGRSTDWVEVA